MRITQEADYALRIILFLSKIEAEERVEARIISEAENIPLRFALKILRKLTQNNLTKSFRGINGGYALNKKPKDINLKDVIEAVDGPIYVNRCSYDKSYCNMQRTDKCRVHMALEKVKNTLIKELEEVTFEDLLKKKD